MAVRKRAKKYIGRIYLDKGAVSISLKNYDDAMLYSEKAVQTLFKDYNRTIRNEPENTGKIEEIAKEMVIANFNKGHCEAILGQYSDALETLNKSISIYHNNGLTCEHIKNKIGEEMQEISKNRAA